MLWAHTDGQYRGVRHQGVRTSQLTARVFGYLIAYILPGASALYVISLRAPWLNRFLDQVLSVDTNTALFLAASLMALLAGLGVSLIRSALFDTEFRQDIPLWTGDIDEPKGLSLISFNRLGEENRMTAALAVVDEGYRYHQFWGGMAVVLPAYAVHWTLASAMGGALQVWIGLGLAAASVLELLLVGAARGSLKRYEKWLGEIAAEGG